MGTRTAAWAVLLTAPFCAAPLCATEWVRVASSHVEVLTDGGEKSGRQLLARFEDIRGIFREANVADHGPVRVFAFSSENEFHAYHKTVAGFYRSGVERDYIALRTGPDAGRVAFHEYVHLVLNHSLALLPRWFEEGLAEFYSTLELNGDRLRVGVPLESHLGVLSRSTWLTAAQLAQVTALSPYYTERDRAGIFYAQSWGLIHMLNLSPAWREGMPQFVLRMSEGDPQEAAFQSAFGRNMNQALSDLKTYLQSVRSVTVGAPARAASAAEVRVEHVTAVESTLALADLALHVDRQEQARQLIARLAREKPDMPEVLAGVGALALAEGRNEEARRQLERAIALGARDPAIFFEYAIMERDAGATKQRVTELLDRVIRLDPEFAEAHFLLGVSGTDDGDYLAAIGHLKKAVAVRPRRSDYWHALGYAQWKANQPEDARGSAKRAVETATTLTADGMAEALLALTKENVPEPMRKRPGVITPPLWQNRKGDARVEGILTNLDCAVPARMRVREAGGTAIELIVSHPGEVELVNAPKSGYWFSCGAQEIRVLVEYLSAEGEVTRIEFPP